MRTPVTCVQHVHGYVFFSLHHTCVVFLVRVWVRRRLGVVSRTRCALRLSGWCKLSASTTLQHHSRSDPQGWRSIDWGSGRHGDETSGYHFEGILGGSSPTLGPVWAKRSQDRPTPGDPGGGRMGPVSRVTHCFIKRPIQEFTVRTEENLGTSLCARCGRVTPKAAQPHAGSRQ